MDFNLGDIRYGSFARQHGSTMRISACDMVYSLAAILEEVGAGNG